MAKPQERRAPAAAATSAAPAPTARQLRLAERLDKALATLVAEAGRLLPAAGQVALADAHLVADVLAGRHPESVLNGVSGAPGDEMASV